MARFQKDSLFSKYTKYNERRYVSLHYHNEIELYLLLKGRIKYFINNKTFFLSEGDLIIVPKQVLHSTDTEDCLYNERLLLSFNSNHFYQEINPMLESLYHDNIIHIPKENLPLIENMFYKIGNEYVKGTKESEILIKLYTSELITYLYRYKTDAIKPDESTDKIMLRVAEYIILNFSQPLSLQILCKKFSISEGYLSKRFKLAIGTSINEYINYIRITEAEKILSSEKAPITEVALRCGYNDSSYFASVFKKFKGITPYKYQKSIFSQNK